LKRLYTLIIALTLNSIGKITGHIIDYLDIMFLEKHTDYKFDTIIHPYSGILNTIKFYSGLIRWLCVILIVVFVIINVINLMIKYRKNDLIALEKYAKNIKIGLIPFWIFQLCFIIGSIYSNSTGIYDNNRPMFINAVFDFNVIFYVVTSYFMLLFTSIFSIGYIKLLLKNNKIDKKMFNKHKAMQLFFFIDIISIVRLVWRKGGL
jgi:hypothetical protein